MRSRPRCASRTRSTTSACCASSSSSSGRRTCALFVNEIAPRPHNSGHYTIDACITSQFAQQARIAAGLPLGDTRRHGASVMLNLLGDLWFDEAGAQREPDWVAVCAFPGANLHLYAKREARAGRKMGHVTIVAERPDEAKRIALAIADVLGIARW